jgi:hypothetical protein
VAGYSGTPLARKLGIKPGTSLTVVGAPDGFVVPDLPDGVVTRTALRGRADVILSFHTDRAHLARRLPPLMRALDVHGGLWVCWPKKASRLPSDITEDTVREVALPRGLVDVKVCAVDDTWSGLRLCLRRELRAGRTTAAG